MSRLTEHINWTIVVSVGLLLIIGLVNLYSATSTWGESGTPRLLWQQILWFGVGIFFLLILAFSDYRIFEKLCYPFYILSILLVILSLVKGNVVYGHKSWIGIGGFGIQPSEFAKLATIIMLAKFFSANPNPDGYDFIALIKPAIIAIIPTGLVVAQHDLGSAIFFVLIFFSFAWFAKVKTKVIFVILIVGIVTSVMGYQYVLSDYQKARITTFVNPDYDIKGSGYHIAQSRIAVGSGKIFGKGYLKGNINKLRYLPEKHTDFIFPVLAEEWGFLGCFITLAIYFTFLTITIEIAKTARDRFGSFIAVGVCAFFFWQLTINLGGVLGLMPLTGVTLPFLSYGG